jgi:hypothetical protein
LNSLLDRANKHINLKYFNQFNSPKFINDLNINIPSESFYVRNMLILDMSQSPNLQLPDYLLWLEKFVIECLNHESKINSCKKLGYLTIRSGPVITKTDDQ